MSDIINPRVDIAFKKIFGVEENKDILMSLLNSIVSKNDQIDEIELLNPYNERNFKKDKLSILDIKARNKLTQTYFLIEMQVVDELDYHQRSLYTWDRVYSSQLGRGAEYKTLKKTIAIHILNFTCIDYKREEGWKEEHLSEYHHCFTLQDRVTKIEAFKDLEIHTIELSKFEEKSKSLDYVLAKVKTMLDTWVAVLTRDELLDVKKLPKQVDFPEVKKVLQVMKEMTLNKAERERYESHLDYLRLENSALEKRFIDGELKGKLEGKLEVAKNLAAKGFDEKAILELTGLSAEELKEYFS